MTVCQNLAAGAESLALGYPQNAAQQFFSAFTSWWASARQRRKALRGYCAALDEQGQYYRAESELSAGERQIARQEHREQQVVSFAAAGAGLLIGYGLGRLLFRR